MVSKRILLISALALLAACSKPDLNGFSPLNAEVNEIIGGVSASKSDRVTKSTVSLIFNFNGVPVSICTGTLVSRELVLTAAHCVKSKYQSKFSVSFGRYLPTRMADKSIYSIASVAPHPEFKNTTGENDIALIKLAVKAPSSARPVSILDESVSLHEGLSLLLSGFGIVNEIGNQEAADGLKYVRVPLAKLMQTFIITDQRNAKGACSGDSGGPAYLETARELIVVGVTRGPHAGAKDCRHFGEYTNATMFKNFILDEARRLKAEPPWFEKNMYR